MPERVGDGGAGATIRVTRDRTRSKDRRRPYRVVVDGFEAGEVRRGETKDFAVEPGAHELRVSIEFEHSEEWHVSVGDGDLVAFVCRSRGRLADGHVDLFLADPLDRRAHLEPLTDLSDVDGATRQRVVTRDGRVLIVWAHRSGYLRSLDPGADGGSGDEFFVVLAYYILVLPVLSVVRWVRHRVLFKRGWSVGVVRKRRFLWPEKVRVERFPDEAQARARVPEVMAELVRASGA